MKRRDRLPSKTLAASAEDAAELEKSELIRTFETLLQVFDYGHGWGDFPRPVLEYEFHPTRKWRFDLAWPEYKVAVEAQGGIWTDGAHVRGTGYIRDIDKLNTAQVHGWIVLWVTTNHLERAPFEFFYLLREALLTRYRQATGGEEPCETEAVWTSTIAPQ